MSFLLQTFRQLRRRGTVTGLSVGLLALGVAICVSVFSVFDHALVRGLPFTDGDRMVAFSTLGDPGGSMPLEDFRTIEEAQQTFDWVLPLRTLNTMITHGDRTRGVIGSYVSSELFRRLGVAPILGRAFTAGDEDAGSPVVAWISHRLWQNTYGGDPSIIGKTITFNRQPTLVVGVMPPGFHFPLRSDVWGVFERPERDYFWQTAPVLAVGVLAKHSSLAAARQDLARIASILDETSPQPQARVAAVGFYTRVNINGDQQGALRAMMIAALVLLALTCSNLANLRLSESLRRQVELETRIALGSGPLGLIGLLLLENLVLAAGAVVLGLALAYLMIETLGATLLHGSNLDQLFWVDLALDWRAAGFAAACTLVAACLGALPPIVSAMASARSGRVARAGETRTRAAIWSRVLVSLQVGICFALLVAAGLWTSLANDRVRIAPGFRVNDLSSVHLSDYQARVPSPSHRRELLERLRREIGETPGVHAAAYASAAPWGFDTRLPVAFGAEPPVPETAPRAAIYDVSSGFFETLELKLLTGRTFGATDMPGDEVAIVSRSLADRLPGTALEAMLTLEGREPQNPPRHFRIVGVVADLGINQSTARDSQLAIYLPMSAQSFSSFMIVRGRLEVDHGRSQIEALLARTAPLVGILDEQRVTDAMAAGAWVQRRLGQIFSLFATIAWLITAAGVYAVIAVMVRGRARELGIRAAIGAQPRDLQRLILGESARQLAIGLVAGIAVLALGARLLDRVVVDEIPMRPVVIVLSAIVVSLASLFASWAPTREAARTDPTRCLRSS